VKRPTLRGDITPTVSLIIAAYNEADSIEAKLNNIAELDYPADRLQVIIASDGSTDGTNDIIRAYSQIPLTLLELPRQGKAGALNEAVAVATGEVLVFSDANSMYAPDAISTLVRPFADPEVGGVAGNQRYVTSRKDASATAGERAYWGIDRLIKSFQSEGGSAISATGAIYAIRRSVFRTVPVGVTDDFVTSTRAIEQGYRLVFEPNAVAYEAIAKSTGAEFQRKVRIITRGLSAVIFMRVLLNPFRHGFYALQLLTHKVLRRMIFGPLLVLIVVSPLLWSHGIVYQAATLGQVALYGAALIGFLFQGTRVGQSKVFSIPLYFCMIYLACLLATWNIIRGHRFGMWETQREGSSLS
jgi:cellulose synthase/poly-beta-1,6-N-acetylglucosamine synthase-like glycosyltransferase